MSERLLEQVKLKCNITWNDDDTETRVNNIIKSAIPTMLKKLGIADPAFDFGNEGQENTLFVNYCFYEWNHCANEFDDNYANDIAQVRHDHEVRQYLESMGNSNE